MKNINKKNIVFLSLFFVLISNLCFAAGPTIQRDFTIADLFLFLFVSAIIASGFIYFLVFLPYLKRKKTKEFCEKNHLTYTDKSSNLPDNVEYNFIKLGNCKSGELKITYKNIMHGERNGITFTLCEFYIEISNNHGSIGSQNFPLLIINKYNTYFPLFVLSKGMNSNNYKRISYMMGSPITNSNLKSDYEKNIHLYNGKRHLFNHDKNFNNTFVLQVEDNDQVEAFFNDKIRNIFMKKAMSNCVYEGNGEYFIVSKTSQSSFEETIRFFEQNLNLFTELVS